MLMVEKRQKSLAENGSCPSLIYEHMAAQNGNNERQASAGVRRQLDLRDMLQRRDMAGVSRWVHSSRAPLRTLTSLLFDRDELIVWRTIEAFRPAAARIAPSNRNSLKRQLRRFFWMMNDESGALCWHAPEAIAETLVGAPSLANEFGVLLLSYLDEEPFEAGVRWAITRLAKIESSLSLRKELAGMPAKLVDSLRNKDPRIRGNAVLALAALRDNSVREFLVGVREDASELTVYDLETGTLRRQTIGILAKEALAAIEPG